jgi:hypothetical protein
MVLIVFLFACLLLTAISILQLMLKGDRVVNRTGVNLKSAPFRFRFAAYLRRLSPSKNLDLLEPLGWQQII